MTTERFRILSRRVINRIDSMNKTVPYRKAVYSASGLKTANLTYKNIAPVIEKEDYLTKNYRKNLALDSFLIFTDLGFKVSFFITSLMLLFTIFVGIYSLAFKIFKNPVPGWASTILLLSISNFFTFLILTVILKYLPILVQF